MVTSQNGYSANDESLIKTWLIPGTTRKIRLRADDCGFLLTHFAAWFDKAIETIDNDGELDDWGYAERTVRGSATTLSNHASGTAIDLNAPEHPLGVRGTFTETQEAMVRAQLRVYEGCIRWGGDYANRADEMHWEINRPYDEVARVARKLRAPAPGEDTEMTPEQATQLAMIHAQTRANARLMVSLSNNLTALMKRELDDDAATRARLDALQADVDAVQAELDQA